MSGINSDTEDDQIPHIGNKCEMCGIAAPIYHSDDWLGEGPKDIPLRWCATCEPIGLASWRANFPLC